MKRISVSNLRGVSKKWLLEMKEPHLIECHNTPVGVLLTWEQYETARGVGSTPVEGPAVIASPDPVL